MLRQTIGSRLIDFGTVAPTYCNDLGNLNRSVLSDSKYHSESRLSPFNLFAAGKLTVKRRSDFIGARL